MAFSSDNQIQSSYKNIFKATSLFGGVQIYKILISVVKSKIIAILLGPAGMGIQGLFSSATDLIKQITSMGLAQSAVRDVAEANGLDDKYRINKTVSVLQKLVWGTGLLGLLGVIAFSPLLSRAAFGDSNHIFAFICLSICLLFDQLCSGQLVVLQGLRRLKDLAKASAIGSTVGLLVSVPLYYLLGVDGIVPTLILNSFFTLVVAFFYARKIKLEKVHVTTKEALTQGKGMLIMGASMSISSILVTLVSFVIMSTIRMDGGESVVGLFQAGFAIISTYVGLIFNAISSDYYPRLAAINKDNEQCRVVVSKQGEIGTIILSPMLCVCLLAAPLILRILYSDEFVAASVYIEWCSIGMMFKMCSWLIAYVFVAKAESKLFVIVESVGNIVFLLSSVVGYKIGGLMGLGMGFTVNYIIYFLLVLIIAKRKYFFGFTKQFAKCFIVHFSVVFGCFLSICFLHGVCRFVIGGVLAMFACFLSVHQLRLRLSHDD